MRLTGNYFEGLQLIAYNLYRIMQFTMARKYGHEVENTKFAIGQLYHLTSVIHKSMMPIK
jgi:hypothetical protein